jgi:ubiquinone biosynthesis protein
VRADLGIMQDFADVLQRRAQWARDYDLAGIMHEYAKRVLDELDYRNEAYNAILLRQLGKSCPPG